jgi:hypothetical protein
MSWWWWMYCRYLLPNTQPLKGWIKTESNTMPHHLSIVFYLIEFTMWELLNGGRRGKPDRSRVLLYSTQLYWFVNYYRYTAMRRVRINGVCMCLYDWLSAKGCTMYIWRTNSLFETSHNRAQFTNDLECKEIVFQNQTMSDEGTNQILCLSQIKLKYLQQMDNQSIHNHHSVIIIQNTTNLFHAQHTNMWIGRVGIACHIKVVNA